MQSPYSLKNPYCGIEIIKEKCKSGNRDYRDRKIRLSFGKYKNKTLKQIPADYLYWLANQDWIYVDLRRAINAEIDAREKKKYGDTPAEKRYKKFAAPYWRMEQEHNQRRKEKAKREEDYEARLRGDY